MQTVATSPTPTTSFMSLAPLERLKRARVALGKVVANPDDTDQVLEFLTLLNTIPHSISSRIDRFLSDPVGKQLYDERRAIDSRTVDLDALAALPEGTLGHTYAQFLRSRGLTPEIFDGPPAGFDDPRYSYLVQRMRQTHDLWHVVTGCDTDPAGEIALQAFTFAQVRALGNGFLTLTGLVRGVGKRRGFVRDTLRMYRVGKRARSLPVFDWENHWAAPLAEVRALLGLPVVSVARAAA